MVKVVATAVCVGQFLHIRVEVDRHTEDADVICGRELHPPGATLRDHFREARRCDREIVRESCAKPGVAIGGGGEAEGIPGVIVENPGERPDPAYGISQAAADAVDDQQG